MDWKRIERGKCRAKLQRNQEKRKKGKEVERKKKKDRIDRKLIFSKKQEKKNRIGRGKTDLQRKQEKEEREGKELKWKREKGMERYGRKMKKMYLELFTKPFILSDNIKDF